MNSRTTIDSLRQKTWAIAKTALLSAALAAMLSPPATSAPAGYTFEKIATLGDPMPQGGVFVNDFEVNGLNNSGTILFGADVSTACCEGVFLRSKGQLSQLARSGDAAPGGGIFDFGFLGPTSLNDAGDVAFNFLLAPFTFPFGVNAGAYRYSQITKTTVPVVLPYVTPAPTGGAFQGVGFGPSLNNRGALVFSGIVLTSSGIHLPDEPDTGLGMGLFKANRDNAISSVLIPGDPAPGGGAFDWASTPWTNSGGDVAFTGHVAGDECRADGFLPQAAIISCIGSVYAIDSATRQVKSVAHAGAPAPGGGTFRQAMFPVINDHGDIVFLGDLSAPPGANQVTGVYLYSGGTITRIAGPGDAMPGGGHLVTASAVGGNQIDINNQREVVFNAVLDIDVDADSVPDTALFLWSHGVLQRVAGTGTVIPGVGTISRMVMGMITVPPAPGFVPNSGALNNDRGQVLFGATLVGDVGVLLLATPH